MDGVTEVMVLSDGGSGVDVYDLKTGNAIHFFEDCKSVPKGLSFIAEDYLISALPDKPALKVWTLSKSNAEKSLMICPGNVSCLAVSHCGDYCAAGIDRFLYVWEVLTGNMLVSLRAHAKPLSCLRFTSDGLFLISGGKDGLVLVWTFSLLIEKTYPHDSQKPHYVWMDHSGEITDIFVGKLGCFGRVATSSVDMTCKIYELESGNLLTTICTDYEITSITMDNSEYFLFLGSAEGNIYRINLFPIRDGEVCHRNADSRNCYVGHTNSITALSVSALESYLLSGSEDESCRLWDINSFSCLRKVDCEGPATNAFITFLPPGLKEDKKYLPQIRMSVFSRQPASTFGEPFVFQKIPSKTMSLTHVETPDQYFDVSALGETLDQNIQQLKSKVSAQELETINQQLYSYALSDLMSRRSATYVESE